MKRKILSSILAFSALTLNVNAAYTAADIDYSEELAEIKALMQRCDAKGISYEYESINYHTIERFEGYIKEDINDGIAEDVINYNVSVMDSLCTETISALNSYINGTATPKKVNMPDMTKTSVSGNEILSGSKNVYSIGYGHGSNMFEEIEHMGKFGASNVMVEIGPSEFIDWIAPFTVQNSGTTYENIVETQDVHGGKYANKVTVSNPSSSSSYYRLVQQIACEPGTTYEFGGFAKVKATGETAPIVRFLGNDLDYSKSVTLSTGDEWTEYTKSYKTGSTQKTIKFSILIMGEAECMFDDLYVRKAGTTENLLVNGDMEGTYKSKLDLVKKALEDGEKNNVGVNLLLSPHYMPLNITGVEYGNNGFFIFYNINSPGAKVVIEDHIRRIMEEVKDYPALTSIIISNEPVFDTTNYSDFYTPLFRKWLEKKHETIDNLNSAYGNSIFNKYSSFDSISLPTTSDSGKPIYYDWILFNDEVFTEWHKWMADIVKEYTDVPVSAKVMNYLRWHGEDADRSVLRRGTDIELFDEFSDFAGNDAYDVYNDPYSYWQGMMFYDYMASVTGKPVYNSETHIIQDGNQEPGTAYEPATATHSANHMWMSAVRGVSMHSMWIWAHVNNPDNQSFESVLSRPDAVAKIGRAGLDVARLSDEIAELRAKDAKVAIFYSKPSRVYNSLHMNYTARIYQSLINLGVKPGFVSENCLDKLENYDILIMGNVTHGTSAAVSAVESFMSKGGKVLYFGNPMTKNEYNVYKSNSIASNSNSTSSSAKPGDGYVFTNSDAFTSAVNSFITSNLNPRVELKYTDGTKPAMMDWQFSINERRVLVNVTNLEYGKAKELEIYLDGEKLTGMNELISAKRNVDKVTVNGFEPRLLEYSFIKEPAVIDEINVDISSSEIRWGISNLNYDGAKIYKMSNAKSFREVTVADDTYYKYEEPGIYMIKPILGETAENVWIYAGTPDAFDISVTDVVKGGTTFGCVVNTKNAASGFVHGVIKIEILDGEGNVVAYQYHDTNIKGGKTDSFRISKPIPSNAETAVIYAVNSADDDSMISEKITIEL